MDRHFRSWRSYWEFDQSVRNHQRFVHTAEVDDFLATVLETGQKRADSIDKGTRLWRAQLGTTSEIVKQQYEEDGAEFDVEQEVAFGPDRMLPLRDGAMEGRANPKGIPCLYLASDSKTAMAEVRPWVGAAISLGQFELTREAKVIDFSEDDGGFMFFLEEPPPAKREAAVWREINRAFSRPVTPTDRHADYVATQILAELFKANGFDGIVFRSSCGKGHNIALFELDGVVLLGAAPFELKSMSFEFRQTNNGYSVRRE